jgi:Protein of unknown function (DUF1566)
MKHLYCRSSRMVGAAILAMAASWAHHGYADAPLGRYTVANGTVLDTKTNLLWQQEHQGNPLNWNDAKSYCTNLNLNGMSGWRLPNIKELQSIVDEKRTNPAIDPTAFPNTPSEQFWTSSSVAGAISGAWLVRFYDGDGDAYNVSVAYATWVRCVR